MDKDEFLPPILTLSQAAKIKNTSRKGMLRWLQARLHIEPDVLKKEDGERLWSVRRDALQRLVGASDADLRVAISRHGKRLDDHEKRIRHLEHSMAVGGP